jgi:2-C-methyl-D-erythritol 4-phosphate cytidylyltransferase / 2-C-methyl-D-erythritol 2,4-cyclodiphosphate synthase
MTSTAIPSVAAVIVAAGRGVRANTGTSPKQYVVLAGKPVLSHTLTPFLLHPALTQVLVVRHADDAFLYQAAVATLPASGKLLPSVIGGATRQASVLNGLQSLVPHAPSLVLIHDAARPFVTVAMLDTVLAALKTSAAAILASPVTDTIKRADHQQRCIATLPRANLWRAETPQAFRFSEILAAHQRAAVEGQLGFTDDASVAEWAGIPTALVDSGGGNSKITQPDDVGIAAFRISQRTL